jgi:endonuclease-3
MPRESKAKRQERSDEIGRRLASLYPDADCALVHNSPFQLVVATILSAQCTDKRVNMVTPALFETFATPQAFAEADIQEIEGLIRSTGFFRNKAKSIKESSALLVRKHGAEVPSTMSELLELPGVARKTANVVLGNAFGVNDGVVVDTHVSRLSKRLGLSRHENTGKIERDLMVLIAQENWAMIAHRLIYHGRNTCDSRKPRCAECLLDDVCPYPDKTI